ncbi:MAG: hypothetical protein VX733_02135 [Candidatus Latescibacterota bacterium]|nr:hypothetical protein [Candidatus Latescibacterota bacterium]
MSLPLAIIIDDPAPLINVYWWHAAESGNTDRPVLSTGEPVVDRIPVDFLEQFIELVERWSVRGKFSVLPYPAALGPIDQGWPGCDEGELIRWIDLVKRRVTPYMDITPEILTHARALDLNTMAPLPLNERDWAQQQTATTMTPYIGRALQILQSVGLSPTGVTSPWDFGVGVEGEYRTAIRQAMAQIGVDQSWYFLHIDPVDTSLRSEVAWRDGDSWLVSIWAQVRDYLWQTMETGRDDEAYVESIADAYLTQDGTGGRLPELLAAGTPMVLCTHWQSLFSNGRRTGLRILDEICRRVQQWEPEQARWTTCSDLAMIVATSSDGP